MGPNADVIKELYDNFAAGDVPAVLGAMDPNIEWIEADNFYMSDRNPYHGPDAIADGIFTRIVSDVANFGAHPERITDAGDTVVVEGRYKGTVKATGIDVDAQFAHVWGLSDGKITSFQQYTDTAQWAKARVG